MVVAAAEGDDEALGLNGVIEQASAGMRRRRSRTSRPCNASSAPWMRKPAEMLKARYRDKATGRDWIEELVFIEGPDNEIYSVALKCAPRSCVPAGAVLAEVLRSVDAARARAAG